MDDPIPFNVSAMLLCDGVATDEFTGKTTIVGCSGGFLVESLPAILPVFAIYVVLTEVTRRVELNLQMVDIDGNMIAALPTFDIEPVDALLPLQITPRFVNVKVEAEGDYFVELFADGAYIVERRITVQQVRG